MKDLFGNAPPPPENITEQNCHQIMLAMALLREALDAAGIACQYLDGATPAAGDQAMGRAHRMGQLRPGTAYRLVTQGTVEEQIVGLHNDKRALAECILGEGGAVNIPSTEELISLIKGD